ncbi:MAG TPA: hypothetical protein VF101_08225 [Gaiellaceae bacterium]
MRRWTDVFAALAAIALAVIVGLVLRDVDVWGWVIALGFAAAPVALYVGLTRVRTHRSDRIVLSAVLALDVAFYAAAAPQVDDYVLGALIFVLVPLYGVLGLLVALVLLVASHAVVDRISEVRRRRPPTAAAGRP